MSGPEAPTKPSLGERFNAAIYDPFLWLGERRGMRDRRASLVGSLSGRVLEIGAGTGLNMRHYPAGVEELILTEPDAGMAARLRNRLGEARTAARVVEAPAEELPAEDGSVDVVLSTMVLCTVPDPHAAIAEIVRVLAPGGRLAFCEHVLSDSPRLARWQHRLAKPWAAFAEGCRCDRPTHRWIAEALRIERLDRDTWRGMPPIVQPLALGEARA
jgi:ubiquinone/menaquinone biosynthesis C-methylase UbiE